MVKLINDRLYYDLHLSLHFVFPSDTKPSDSEPRSVA